HRSLVSQESFKPMDSWSEECLRIALLTAPDAAPFSHVGSKQRVISGWQRCHPAISIPAGIRVDSFAIVSPGARPAMDYGLVVNEIDVDGIHGFPPIPRHSTIGTLNLHPVGLCKSGTVCEQAGSVACGRRKTSFDGVLHVQVRPRQFDLRNIKVAGETLPEFIRKRMVGNAYSCEIENWRILRHTNSLQDILSVLPSYQYSPKRLYFDCHFANLFTILLKSAAFSTRISKVTIVPSHPGNC